MSFSFRRVLILLSYFTSRQNICLFPKGLLHVCERTHTHTRSVCDCTVCVDLCDCVLGEGWLLLKCGAPVWTFPRLESRRQLPVPALGYLNAPPLLPGSLSTDWSGSSRSSSSLRVTVVRPRRALSTPGWTRLLLLVFTFTTDCPWQ